MAGIKSRPISSLPLKDSLTSEARLPIIDKDDAGRLDNYSMAVATLATLARGPKGDPGERGIDGRQGAPGKQGNPGPAGPAGKDGVSVPRGGATGQQLVKNSNADYDFSWKTSEGAGDMIASVYDPSTKAKEVAFKDETTLSLNQKADKATTYTKSETYSKSEVDSKLKNVPSSAPSPATSTTKGIIKLSGDLGGNADTPTVPGLANKEPRITTGNTTQYWRGDKTWQNLNKVAVGLPNVDNTSDINKPISNATRLALSEKADKATTYTKVEVNSLASRSINIKYMDGTSTVLTGSLTQKGVGYGRGNDSNTVDIPVTFPERYSTVDHVAGGSLGIRVGSAPSSLADLNAGYSGNIMLCQPYNITQTGFTMRFTLDSGAPLSHDVYAGFWWIAEGRK